MSTEIEANLFSMCLLMPESLIVKEVERLQRGRVDPDNQVRILAMKFKVSEQLMSYRLAKLGYELCFT